MRKLDSYQVELSGLHLIEASAGTGKTHAITTLYLRAVVELGLLPEQILVVTFTRAATGELRERIRTRLRLAASYLGGESVAVEPGMAEYLDRKGDRETCRQRLERALLVIDQASVMTIHGFCAKVLEQNAFESHMPFGAQLVESLDQLLEEVVNDFVVTHLAVEDEAELRAIRAVGLGFADLRELGAHVLAHDGLAFEPCPSEDSPSFGALLQEFEQCRLRARSWLDESSNVSHLARLNKAKPPGSLGKRLADHVAKVKIWLAESPHLLKHDCESFVRFYELAEKYPEARTDELHEWFGQLAACSKAFERLRRGILERCAAWRRRFVDYLLREIQSRKAAQNVRVYDDLLRDLKGALSGGDGERLAQTLRERYPLALIDEFQDTDPVQFEVFSSIYDGGASLFLIGDPKQSIYAFRGADVDNYLVAKRDERVRTHTLDVNWRSDPLLIAGVDSLYRGHIDPFLGAGIEFVRIAARPSAKDLQTADAPLSGVRVLRAPERDEGAVGRVLIKRDARKLAIAVAVEQVQRLLQQTPDGWSRKIRASDIAILGRTNRECEAMAGALRTVGIRCVQTSASSVFSSAASESVALYLRALLTPKEPRFATALMLDTIIGMSPSEVESLRSDPNDWDDWVERLQGLRSLWERSGLLAAIVRTCDELDIKARLLGQAAGERYLTDLFHVAELVQAAGKQLRLGPEAQFDWLMRARLGNDDCTVEDQQLRIEADSDAVLLTTVHRSKGLEFPFVICPFLWDGRRRRREAFLSYKPSKRELEGSGRVVHLEPRLLDADAEPFRMLEAERLREDARLLYVALTRAKHQVVVVWLDASDSERSALHHLLSRGRDIGAGATTDGKRGPMRRLPLAELWHGSPGVIIENVEVDSSPGTALAPSTTTRLVAPKTLERIVRATVTTTSYSALTSVATPHAEVGRDVDFLGLDSEPSEAASVPAMESDAPDLELPLLTLPVGPRTGEALHAVLEHADFQAFDQCPSEPDLVATLERFGLDGGQLGASVRRGLRGALATRLLDDDPELRLDGISLTRRKSEFEFLMRIQGLSVEGLMARLTPELSGVGATYTDDLRKLRFDPVSGYLRGFVDLVFEHRGRVYVADYKSNALGNSVEAFEREKLEGEMRKHHYPVQAALYAAAVDGWLRATRRGYSFEEHFGGVFYLFLRGMSPELGPRSGVVFHRPSWESLREFELMLKGSANG